MARNAHRGCDDFRQTSAATRRQWEVPSLTRRQLIGTGLGAGLAVYASKAMPLARILEAAEAEAAAAPNAPVLVSVFLPGGCDLLDTLIPVGEYGRYADLRKNIKIVNPPLLGSTGFGIHPSLAQGLNGGVKGLFEAGKVGFLPGIDYGNPDLSHFHSRHFWETGMIIEKDVPGWLGRWLDRRGSADNPLQGLSVDYSLSPVMRSGRAPVAAVSSPGDAQLGIRGVYGRPEERALGTWQSLAQRNPRKAQPRATMNAARLAKSVGDRLAPYVERDDVDPLAPPVAYPAENEFGRRLSRLAALISLPLGVRVATVDASGEYDTHDDQPTDLADALRDASTALASFQADLEARGVADRVLTVVWSEFGRRPESNDSDGTDHGAGGIAWVQGTRANPGIHSPYPSLTQFDRDDNLLVTLDFRALYSSALEQWLGTGADEVIPNARAFGRVPIVR